MGGYSYTKLTRFYKNPARAFAYYYKGDTSAYDFELNDAMLLGTLVHKALANQLEEWEPTEQEREKLFRYGDPDKGLKSAFANWKSIVGKVDDTVDELYKHLGLSPDKIEYELEFHGLFHGFVDYIDHENKIILDYKIISPRTDFNKAWDSENGRYDTWAHSTMYDWQAFIYQSAFEDYTHYIVAVTSDGKRSRVIDMGGVVYSDELITRINDTMTSIDNYVAGEETPIVVDDGSEWAEAHKPFEVEVF